MVALNAGAALYVAGLADSIPAGVAKAADVLRNGKAWARVEQLADFTSNR